MGNFSLEEYDPNYNDSGPLHQHAQPPADIYELWWFYSFVPYRISIIYIASTIAPLVLSLFGTVTNIINIIVFYRQGLLANSCTPSLVGLFLSDFCNCLIEFFATAFRCHFHIAYAGQLKIAPRLVSNQETIGFFIEKWGIFFSYLTCWMTLYMAFVRMISVTFPFHVKQIFTAKRSCVVIAALFTICFLLQVPQLFVDRLVVRRDIHNAVYLSIISFQIIPEQFFRIYTLVYDAYIRLTAILLMVVFNVIVVARINLSSSLRMRMSISTKPSTKAIDSYSQNEAVNSVKDVQRKRIF